MTDSNAGLQPSLFGDAQLLAPGLEVDGEGAPSIPEGAIWGFDSHGFLSNFHPSPVRFEGVLFPTVEHAFQAAKTMDLLVRTEIAHLPTPGKAKRAGRRLHLRDDWEAVKVGVMRQLVQLKFAPGTRLARQLTDTHPSPIFEANHWHDRFWGVDRHTGVGLNHLGRILEEVRADLVR